MSVRVQWVGRWKDSWVNVTQLNARLKREARRKEAALFGVSTSDDEDDRPSPARRQPARGCKAGPEKRGRRAMGADDWEAVICLPRRRQLSRVVMDETSDEEDDDENTRAARRGWARRKQFIVDDDDSDSD